MFKGMGGFAGVLFLLGLWLSSIAAWITHVVACIKAGAWILLIVGALLFPIGVIHGWMIWFGASWAH